MQKVHFCKQCTNKNVISLNRSKSICIYNKLICTALGNKGVSSELLPKEIDKFKFWNVCYISVAGKVVKVTAMGQV